MRAALVLAFVFCLALPGAAAQSALDAGVRALDAHRLDAARAHLRTAQRAAPRDPDVLAALARFHLDEELPDRAAAREYVYRGLLRDADHTGLLRLRLRMAYEDSGAARFETMETLHSVSRRLLRQDPRDPAALRACGQSGLDDIGWRIGTTAVPVEAKGIERRYDEAAACLDTLLALDPRDAAQRERLRLALLTMHTGDARRLTERWAAADPDRAEAWRWHGLALWFEGDERAAGAFGKSVEQASEAEKARWRDPARVRAPGADSVEAEVFWANRDPLLSTPANERWTEHLARLALADLFFGEGATPGSDTKRGAMLVRYGLPADVPGALSGYGPFVSPSEGRLAAWDYGDFQMVFQDWFVSGQFKYYSPPASAFSGSDAPNDYTLIARSLYRRMPERMVVPGVEDLGVLAAYVFPDGEAPAVVLAAQSGNAAPMQAFAVSEGGVEKLKSLGQAEVGDVQVFGGALAPGAYRVQAEQQRGDIVAVTQDSVSVAPLTGVLALSSLVPARWVEEGRSAAAGTFARGGMAVAPAPDGVFQTGVPLYLYVEVYNLHPGAPYEVEIERIGEGRRRLFGRTRRSPVAVRFEETARNATARSYYVLDTADAAPGAYTIRLSVRDADGRRAQTACSVVLRAPSGMSENPSDQ